MLFLKIAQVQCQVQFCHPGRQKWTAACRNLYIQLFLKWLRCEAQKKMQEFISNDSSQSFSFPSLQPQLSSKLNPIELNSRTFYSLSQLSQYMQIDQLIKIDQFQVLRYDFLNTPLQELIYLPVPQREYILLFIDPLTTKHIISKSPHTKLDLPTQNPPSITYSLDVLKQQNLQNLTFSCTNVLATKLPPNVVQYVSKTQLISLDQVRLKCQANLYTEAVEVESDVRRLISWCQIYRANSLKAFQYLSNVFQKIVALLTRKDFFRKFDQIKQTDLNRLLFEQYQFKMSPSQWPFVPESFREYQQIQEYVPTPSHRAPIINERICSKKEPVQCPPNCVCLTDTFAQGEYFCQYSLANGWETSCPNRSRKLQCNHSEQQDQKKCKNSEIKKHNRKKCKGKMGVLQGEAQIQQRLTWGIDLYTRNIIYHLLPEFDIQGTRTKVANQQRKYCFIQKTLSKALNFLGAKGFSFVEACQYIKQHSETALNQKKKPTLQQSPETQGSLNQENILQKEENANEDKANKQYEQVIFTQKDVQYADLLLRNYELCQDKSAFRMHTKGKGAICIDHKGITQGSFIVEYFGEIYQPWRWFDRQDFVKQVMKKKKFKNYMPQFYNIALEKHPDQPLGCDILMVDPSRKGNFSSRFSHSCDPNCGTIITVSNGQYYIGMYAFKDIAFGQELTFDYCSMTESNYQHLNSICLCGMRRCRGYYLQLSNTKMFSNLMDNKNCFFTRNSAIVNSKGKPEAQHLQICALNNIKEGLLAGSPQWLTRWMAQVLKFISEEGAIYKQSLVDSWRKNYPWANVLTEEEKQENIQKYSLISRQQLESIRFQNLITSVDKIKYFLSKNLQNLEQPPIFIESHPRILDILIYKQDSVLLQLQQNLIRYKMEVLASIIERFIVQINRAQSSSLKLSLFRLCCLLISHRLLYIRQATFNNQLLSDIVYFYAFTHTYFTPTQYKAFDAQEITVSVNQILGKASPPNQKREKSRKKYASPFLWGQMASWFKQTIVCPQASLSQDRRGTLSYPLIRSIMRSEYPYEKQSRSYFQKMLLQKPANSWPPAPGCDLSFKNPYKLYGTLLFQNVHSRKRLQGLLPKQTLLESCLLYVNLTLNTKLDLFKTVESVLGGLPKDHSIYQLTELGGDHTTLVPYFIRQGYVGEPRKRGKKEQEEDFD